MLRAALRNRDLRRVTEATEGSAGLLAKTIRALQGVSNGFPGAVVHFGGCLEARIDADSNAGICAGKKGKRNATMETPWPRECAMALPQTLDSATHTF